MGQNAARAAGFTRCIKIAAQGTDKDELTSQRVNRAMRATMQMTGKTKSFAYHAASPHRPFHPGVTEDVPGWKG